MIDIEPIGGAEARRILAPIRRPFLVGFEVENLRGFRRAALDLSNDLTVLVGPNNSGKTSIFRLLDWLLNGASEDTPGRHTAYPRGTAAAHPRPEHPRRCSSTCPSCLDSRRPPTQPLLCPRRVGSA